jgi:hypothetical protein
VAGGQTYANHVYRPTAWTITVTLALIATGLILWSALRQPLTAMSAGLALLAVAAFLTINLLRLFALRLQNRIIRTEMHIRLMRLGREADLARLTMAQIVALRFASDAEMSSLIDRVITEQMKPDAIKRAVTDWQGDYLRT